MHRLFVCFLLLLISVSVHRSFAQCAAAVNGNDYYVTDTIDGSPGSLRQAILDANAQNTGGRILNFSNGFVFPIFSPLPDVTCDSLVIFPNGGGFFFISGSGLPEPGYSISALSSCMDPYVTGINFQPSTFTVTNTNDAGLGSLRRAIEYSNFSASDDVIHFNIPGAAPHAIHLNSELPAIHHSLTINGSSQPPNGFTGSGPTIEMDGGNNTFQGLDVDYDDINYHFSVFGLYIHGFNLGIRANNGGGATGTFNLGSNQYRRNIISGNNMGALVVNDSIIVRNTWVGTDTSGLADQGNVYYGLSLIGGPCILQNNLISGNDSLGVHIASSNITATGNIIGADKSGSFAIPNKYGVNFANAGKLIFGGPNSGDGNLLSGNTVLSGHFFADTILFIGNKIGTDITGTDTISGGSSMNAVDMVGFTIRIGGTAASESNIFAGPGYYGVDIHYFDTLIFINNIIGTDPGGTGSFPFTVGARISANSSHQYQLVSGNKFANNYYGIWIDANPAGADTLINNEFYNNTVYGIFNIGQRQVFTSNSIYNNGKGIENDGASNNLITTPFITWADNSNVSGTSDPFAIIELFYNLSFNTNPQGFTMIGSTTADANGNWHYQGVITNATNVTTTQTDTVGNTSEFSPLWVPTAMAALSDSKSLNIFPNPAIDHTFICHAGELIASISMYDAKGQLVSKVPVKENCYKLDTTDFENGIYTLVVTDYQNNTRYSKLSILH